MQQGWTSKNSIGTLQSNLPSGKTLQSTPFQAGKKPKYLVLKGPENVGLFDTELPHFSLRLYYRD